MALVILFLFFAGIGFGIAIGFYWQESKRDQEREDLQLENRRLEALVATLHTETDFEKRLRGEQHVPVFQRRVK